MPWCLLKSSMVSLNNLCVSHGPAGWGEYSGSAETLWAPVVPPPCWRMGVYAPRAGTASDHFPTSTSSTGRWGEPAGSPSAFHHVKGRSGSTPLVRSPYGDETWPWHVSVDCWHDHSFVWHPKSPGNSTLGSRCFFMSEYLHSSLLGFKPN